MAGIRRIFRRRVKIIIPLLIFAASEPDYCRLNSGYSQLCQRTDSKGSIPYCRQKEIPSLLKEICTEVLEMCTKVKEICTEVLETCTNVKEICTEVMETCTNVKEMCTEVKVMYTKVREMTAEVKEMHTKVREMTAEVKEMHVEAVKMKFQQPEEDAMYKGAKLRFLSGNSGVMPFTINNLLLTKS